jgi:hypothetical protein
MEAVSRGGGVGADWQNSRREGGGTVVDIREDFSAAQVHLYRG